MTARLGDYRLGALLGDGGMGAVYEAFDERLARRVAIKVLHPEFRSDTTALARFRREALATSSLAHPNVVEVFELVEPAGGGAPYLVMEHIDGRSLRDEIESQGALPVERVALIAAEVLAGVGAAHAAGIVHRDLKPSNIVLTRATDTVKLVDFGIAKLLESATKLTESDAVLGTPLYMAPEQVHKRSIDGRTDIYGLGATLYHAVSGERPYANIAREALLQAIGNVPLKPLLEVALHVDPRFAAIVERAMATRPEDRFASTDEMASALDPWVRAALVRRVALTQTSVSEGVDAQPTHLKPFEAPKGALPFDPDLVKAGDVLFEKFLVERVLGRGGMGIVFAARHQLLDQTVALKVLVDARDEAKKRFVNEARIAARIAGEHICRVMDVGIATEGPAFIVMELLSGKDLEGRLEESGPLPVEEALDYVLQALRAVGDAHAAGVVHRDLKPSNIFLARASTRSSTSTSSTSNGGRVTVKVLDFGISKLHPVVSKVSELTKAGSVMGSPAYMAPEQIRATSSVDLRADIWSIGVVLYEILTGRVPFQGASVGQILAAVMGSEPVPLGQLRPDVPAPLAAAVMKCLSKDPAERFADVPALVAALMPFGPAAQSTPRLSTTFPLVAPSPSPSLAPPPPAVSAPAGATVDSWSALPAAVPARAESRASIGRSVAIGLAVAVVITGTAVGVVASRSRGAALPVQTSGPSPGVSSPATSAIVSLAVPPASSPSASAAAPAPAASSIAVGSAHSSNAALKKTTARPPSSKSDDQLLDKRH